jgi:hypothetical protein
VHEVIFAKTFVKSLLFVANEVASWRSCWQLNEPKSDFGNDIHRHYFYNHQNYGSPPHAQRKQTPSPEKKDKTRRGARGTSEVQFFFTIVSTVGPKRVRLALPWKTGKKKAT